MIPESLRVTLQELRFELEAVGTAWDEYVLFGSTPLILRGVIDREPGDVDIFVTRRVWGALLARDGWSVETPKAGDPPILVYIPEPGIGPAVNAFFDWTADKPHVRPENCFASATLVEEGNEVWMCASNEEILAHKEGALAQKHINDIAAIKEANGDDTNR